MGPIYWDRLCKHGWVLDRMRLVQLACFRPGGVPIPRGMLSLWGKLLPVAPKLDWRNGWRDFLTAYP
jgi:hypothetical protein